MTGGAGWEPTSKPVWRGSYDEDDHRAQVTMPFADVPTNAILKFIDTYVLGLKQLAVETKTVGKAHHITHNMIAVVEALLRNCTDFKTGRCTPSINAIMIKTRFARPTVIALLARLRKWTGMDWVRRTVKTGNLPGEGPTLAQTTNAYFIDFTRLPSRLMMYLRQKLKGVFDFDAIPEQKGSPLLPSFKERMAMKWIRKASKALTVGRRGTTRHLLQTDMMR